MGRYRNLYLPCSLLLFWTLRCMIRAARRLLDLSSISLELRMTLKSSEMDGWNLHCNVRSLYYLVDTLLNRINVPVPTLQKLSPAFIELILYSI